MKIGAFAKKFNLSLSTIRYYIDQGILIPNKNNTQYEFKEKDVKEMEVVLELKHLNFNLEEIQDFLRITRVYEYGDKKMYTLLWKAYNKKKCQLLDERKELLQKIHLLDKRMNDCESHQIQKITPTGIPFEFIGYLACPKCGSTLDLDGIKIHNHHIISGHLKCKCTYKASVEDGILLTGNDAQNYSKFDFLNLYFCFTEQNFDKEIDFVMFHGMETINSEIASYMKKSYDWIDEKLKTHHLDRPIIFVPDIAAHFLYKNLDSTYFKNAFIIVSGFSKEIVNSIKSHIDALSPDLNIIYIANTIHDLPIQESIIDIFIDAFASLNFSFFHDCFLIDKINKYLKSNASVAGATFYYPPYAKSIKKIKEIYPNSLNKHPMLSYYLKEWEKFNIRIEEKEEIGKSNNPGLFFDYHAEGDFIHLCTIYGKKFMNRK